MYLIMKAQGQLNSSVIYFSCVINPELYCGNARVSMYNRWCNLYIRQHKAFLRQGRNSGNSSILILTFLFCSFRESVCVSKWSNVQLFRLWIFRFPRNLDCSNLWSIVEIQINRLVRIYGVMEYTNYCLLLQRINHTGRGTDSSENGKRGLQGNCHLPQRRPTNFKRDKLIYLARARETRKSYLQYSRWKDMW